MSYFRNFQLVPYYFGDELRPTQFQNLASYIDLIDQIANDASFYEKYEILDGARPDTLSFRLYGTVDYYWSFYLLNEKLRRQGWPLTTQELYTKSKEYYPNKVLTTSNTLFDRMKRNDLIIQGSTSDPAAIGTVVERKLDLGQLVVKPIVEVRRVTINNPGAGYTNNPTITIFDEHGDRHEETIVSATASASISGGEVTSIAIIRGGSGYNHAPTVRISEPQLIDYEVLAQSIEGIVNGTVTSGVYYNLLNQTFNGYKRGDVNRNGSIDLNDAALIRSFGVDTTDVDVDTRQRINTAIRQAVLQDFSTYPLWVPYGITKTTATATAVLSSSTFSTGQIVSVPGVGDWRNFNPSDQLTVVVDSVANQYDAVHHYENGDGDWVDIDPFNLSVGSNAAVSYFDRLERTNDELKSIKVLKPSVAAQVFNEFQKLLRENNA